MAYSEQDRAYVRHFVGYGAIFLQAEPRLENAITATQSVADGGGRPDSTTENFVKGVIYGTTALPGVAVTPGPTAQNIQFAAPPSQGLLTIEQLLSNLWPIAFAINADNGEARIDTFRAMVQLRGEGRRLAHSLARMLGMRGVRADMFAPAPVIIDDNPFSYDNMQHWRTGP